MTKNSIDIVIPTMWRHNQFTDYLKRYQTYDNINHIYLIDNDHTRCPKDLSITDNTTRVWYGRNIYVNPAWNEGYYRSRADILCLLNDDIWVESEIFDYMAELDFTDIDLIGVHLRGSVDNYHIVEHPDRREELIKLNVNKTQPIGGQSYAFGVCMFIPRNRYRVIPSLYQIWFGDDYLIQRARNIYTLKTSRIHGEISKTIVEFDKDSDVQRRIELDAHNAYRFNHFLNGQNWDLVQQTIIKSR